MPAPLPLVPSARPRRIRRTAAAGLAILVGTAAAALPRTRERVAGETPAAVVVLHTSTSAGLLVPADSAAGAAGRPAALAAP